MKKTKQFEQLLTDSELWVTRILILMGIDIFHQLLYPKM